MTAERCLVFSDFNLSNFAALVGNDPRPPALEARLAPLGPPLAALLDEQADHWRPAPGCALVWTRPQAVVESFQRLEANEEVALEELLDEVDAFADGVLMLRDRLPVVLVAAWVDPAYERGDGLADLEPGRGRGSLLAAMNQRLAERLAAESGFHLLNTARWVSQVGPSAFQPRMWYLAKCPFGNPLLKVAAHEVKAALAAVRGHTRKLVIVDLDHTLWGGVVGEVGIGGLRLGGHDAEGEALVDFQHGLKALTHRGVLLAIASKNDEEVALEAIRRHPEMVLELDDFAGWRIDWRDKAANISELVGELGLGLDSVVFIDDNPAERSRVAEALPDVLVPDWPADKTLYPRALAELSCFDSPARTTEDRQRTRLYAAERRRSQARTAVASLDDWLESLSTRVTVAPLDEVRLRRAAQLLNKTNQMNMATRRLPEAELEAWAAEPRNHFWTLEVEDRFGRAGLTGLLSLSEDDGAGRIIDFVLSCRVIGRKVEELMAALAVGFARRLGLSTLTAELVPTERNGPCRDFWLRSGFSPDEERLRFTWALANDLPPPEQIRVEDAAVVLPAARTPS